jgi:hypothetical protein
MEHKEVIEYYNNGQDEYNIESIFQRNNRGTNDISENDPYYVSINCNQKGFYEWLFNPRYKVFEVFKLGRADMEENIFEVSWVYNYTTKQPQEILDYLKNQIGGSHE